MKTTSTGVGGQGAGLLQGHVGSSDGELGAAVGSSRLLGVVEPGAGIEVVDAPVALRGGPAEALPEGVDTDSAGCDDPQAGYGNASTLHQASRIRFSGSELGDDDVEGATNGLDALEFGLLDGHVEFFFEGHHQFDGVQ